MLTSKKIPLIWKVILTILLCEITGMTSALISNGDMYPWFDTLNKPSWNPPDYVFAPVWITLYFLMGISLGLIWQHGAAEINKRPLYFLFFLQLFLNFWWSIIFFKFHFIGLALLDIVALVVILFCTMISFLRYSKVSAWLLVPYLVWVCFATILNYAMWDLNNK